MNCHKPDCNVVINAPRALICAGVSTQVMFLESLHKAGLLK